MVARGWVYGGWIGKKCLKFARADELSDERKFMLVRLGYRKCGPYLVKTVG